MKFIFQFFLVNNSIKCLLNKKKKTLIFYFDIENNLRLKIYDFYFVYMPSKYVLYNSK